MKVTGYVFKGESAAIAELGVVSDFSRLIQQVEECGEASFWGEDTEWWIVSGKQGEFVIVESDDRVRAIIDNLTIEDVPVAVEDEFIVVFDLEHEGFGVYKTAEEALSAVQNSNPRWWANRPGFYTIRCKGCAIETRLAADGSEYQTLIRPGGEELNPYGAHAKLKY